MKSASPRDEYRRFLRDFAGPALREHGYKGSGRLFRHQSGPCWNVVGFQASVSSSVDEVVFTANLAATSRTVADLLPFWDGETPPVAEPEGSVVWERLGFVLTNRQPQDTWWVVQRGIDAESVAAELVDTVRAGAEFLAGLSDDAGLASYLLRRLELGMLEDRRMLVLAALIDRNQAEPWARHDRARYEQAADPSRLRAVRAERARERMTAAETLRRSGVEIPEPYVFIRPTRDAGKRISGP